MGTIKNRIGRDPSKLRRDQEEREGRHGRTVQKRSKWTGLLWCCGQPPRARHLESEVKCALGSTAINKARGCDGIPVELLKPLRTIPSRCCIQYVSKSGRPNSGHRTGKCQSSSKFPRRVVLKNVLTIGQLHSSLMLVRSCLKSYMLGFSIMWTKSFQMFKLGLEKEEEPEINFPTFTES